MPSYEISVIILMLIFSAICSAYEMGLATISRSRISVLVNEHKRGAAEAAFMKDNMEASFALILTINTIVNAVAAAAGGVIAEGDFAPYLAQVWHISMALAGVIAFIFIVIPIILVTIIFAEAAPKMFALKNREWIVLRLSPVWKILAKVIDPFVSVIEFIVKKVVAFLTRLQPETRDVQQPWIHELRAAVSLARTSQLMGEREEKIVLAAAHLSTHRVRDIMMPAQDISTIYIGSSLSEALVKAHLDMHTRFPICTEKDDPQSIEGYINFKDIVSALRVNPSDPTIKGISRPIQKVNEDTPLSRLLEEMIREKNHIVIVASKEGTILGMVTLEDIIEELVGEIEDEFDRLPMHIHPYGSSGVSHPQPDCWIVGGGVSMGIVASTAGLDWSSKFGERRIPTVAEWCVQQVGQPLKGGEVIEKDGLRIVPRKFRRKKVSEAMVTVIGH
jgi:putative hemolysin